MAPYQRFKIFLVDTIGLSKDGFHFVFGFFVYIIFNKLFRIKFSSAKSLIAPVVFALLLEVMDFRDATSYGYRLGWADSAKDILVTVSMPVVIWILLRLKNKF